MQRFIAFLVLFISSLYLLSACSTFTPQTNARSQLAQTAITDDPKGESHPGKIIWHDLITPAPQLAGQFYQSLFGWKIDYKNDYVVIYNGNKRIGGILKSPAKEGQEKPAVWLPSISVPDIDLASKLVTENGGTLLKGPADMGLRGRAVLISDPQRIDMVLLDTHQADPADKPAEIGDWLWNEIWTVTPDGTEDFYAAVLGYDQVIPAENYDVLMRDKKWRAGVRHIKDEQRQQWVPVVRVADPQATSQRVESLGGKVLVRPDNAANKGETALISDPTGALLLIQRWPSQTIKGGE